MHPIQANLTSARALALALVFFGAALAARAPHAGAQETAFARAVLITVHGLRADAVSATDAPGLAALARESLSFEAAYSSSPQSIPALASIHAGLLPTHHGMADAYTSPLGTVPTIASTLANAGWRTLAYPADVQAHRRSGLQQGFEGYRHAAAGWTNEARADTALAALTAEASQPTFAWVGFSLAPRRAGWERLLGSESPDPAAYRARVREVDSAISRLIGRLPDRVAVVLVGTHGEHVPGLDDDALLVTGSGIDLHDSALHVPLFVRAPGVAADRASTLASSVDIAPTLCDLLDVDAFETDGVSLLTSPSGVRHVFAETDTRRVTGLAARISARGTEGVAITDRTHTAILPADGTDVETAEHALLGALDATYGAAPRTRADLTTIRSGNEAMLSLLGALETGRAGNPRGARALVESLAVAHPQNGAIQIEQGRALSYARNERGAASFFDDLRLRRPELIEAEGAYHQLLRLFSRHDVIAERMDSLDAGPMYEPEQLWSHATGLLGAKEYRAAESMFTLAEQRSAPPTEWFGRCRESLPALSKAADDLELFGAGYDTHLRLGQLLGELSLFRDAYTHINQARGLKSFDPEPEYWLGHYLVRDNRPRHAIVAFGRALERDPEHLPSLTAKAYAHLSIGELDLAFDALAAAALLSEASPDVHYNYACLLARRNRIDEGLLQLEIAIVKGYSNVERLEHDADLDPLRDHPRFPEVTGRVSSR